MKKIIVPLLLLALLISCTTNDNTIPDSHEILGKWKLVETFEDPGDGSGVFEPVESNQVIEFFKNGKFETNGSSCYLGSQGDSSSSGHFNVSQNVIYFDGDCEFNNNPEVIFSIENSYLIIGWRSCIEGCYNKYEKLE